MQFLILFVWGTFVLSGSKCLASKSGGDLSADSLVFVPFEPFVSCGDGSPAGIYREASPDSVSRNNHVMLFLGGGACTNDENCREKMTEFPYLFSSDQWPQYLKGHTLLSRNATKNPVANNFTRWVVPYCSQDLYVGNGNPATEISRAGDIVFESALNNWRDSLSDSELVETLIVGGISAGAIGLMNHIDSIQNVSRDASVGKLRLIMDSAAIASYDDGIEDIDVAFLEDITDFAKHPLCSMTHTQDFQQNTLWNIPCCLSIHCMLENDPVLQNLTQRDDGNRSERLLLLDSVYDAHALMTASHGSGQSLVPSNSDIDSFVSKMLERGGARRQQILQSAYGSVSRLGKNVLWAVTNVVAHTYLLPALEIEQLRCGDSISRETESIDVVCKEDGLGIRGELIYGLNATAWFTTESWYLCTVDEVPIRNIIFEFVHADEENMTHGLIRDNCTGPNCTPVGATERNPAQELFVVNDELVSISQWLQILLSCIAVCLIFTYSLRLLPVKFKESKRDGDDIETQSSTFGLPNEIRIKGVSVKVQKTDKIILDNISFEVFPGTITGLMGSSGAGKSTLFNLLCGQLPSGLIGCKRSRDFERLGIQSTYLRQFGNSSFQNIELGSYLTITAKLYGASETELASIVSFLRESFADRVGRGPNFGDIKMKHLSGGQQRMVEIIATLLTKPNLLLLDEPLSGLDSVSSLLVMKFLRDLVNQEMCSIIISIHQPSDIILEQMDRMMVLQGGILVVNNSIQNLSQQGTRSPSAYTHDILDTSSSEEEDSLDRSFFSNRLISDQTLSLPKGEILVAGSKRRFSFDVQKEVVHDVDSTNQENTFKIGLGIWQIQLLMRRMHLEHPVNIFKTIELPVCFIFFTTLMKFDEESPAQILFANALFCCSTVFVYQPLLMQACTIFNVHEVELQDRRVSPTALFLASFFFLSTMPLCSLALSLSIGYGILGWDFGTYVDQYLLATLYFFASNQMGRVLVVFHGGVYRKVYPIYVLYCAFSAVMSGIVINPNKLPLYIRWLTYLSGGFWSTSGITLVHLEQGSFSNGICLSLTSCIFENGAFLARLFGYTPMGSTRLSYVVLLSTFAILFVTEDTMMRLKYGLKNKSCLDEDIGSVIHDERKRSNN